MGETSLGKRDPQPLVTLSSVLQPPSEPPVVPVAGPSIMAELMILILKW